MGTIGVLGVTTVVFSAVAGEEGCVGPAGEGCSSDFYKVLCLMLPWDQSSPWFSLGGNDFFYMCLHRVLALRRLVEMAKGVNFVRAQMSQ